MIRRNRIGITWLGYLLWAVFVNAANVWLITPLVEDYAILGVVSVVIIVTVWLVGLPPSRRRRWVVYTLFALLIGQGLSTMAKSPTTRDIALGVVMCLALIFLAWGVGRVRIRHLTLGALVVVLISMWMPFSEWPFFTHFAVADTGNLKLSTSDFSSLPVTVVQTKDGQAVITAEQVSETKMGFLQRVTTATTSTDELQNVLSSYDHLYELVALGRSHGRVTVTTPTAEELAKLNPVSLDTQFPFTLAHWSVVQGHVFESFTPVLTSQAISNLEMTPTQIPNETVQLARQVQQQEHSNWQLVLQQFGTPSGQSGLGVTNGVLHGTVHGQTIRVPTGNGQVIGTGNFTETATPQLLFEGLNTLKVVSLQDGGTVVATYQGHADHPLPSDIVIGPIDNSGRDVIFVNSSPAVILQAMANGSWKQLYQAPNPLLRFEASVRFAGDGAPEIITNDPSLLQPSTARYLSSYTYRSGKLIRNWRVYRTGVARVLPVEFNSQSNVDLLATVAGTGKFVVLKRHQIPVVPIASIVLFAVILWGYIWRWREQRQRRRGDVQ